MNFKYYKTERLIPFIIALTIICTYLSKGIEHLLQNWHVIAEISQAIDTFTILSLEVLVFLGINFFAWKWQIFKWLIDLPDLNGRYEGIVVSSYIGEDGQPERKECVMEIKQTASSIHIYAYFGDIGTHDRTSSSKSVSEELVKGDNGFFSLYYIFTNESEVLLIRLNNHLGTARFKYYPDIKSLDGEYYNQRKNVGTIQVKFIQEKLLGRLIP